MKYRTYDVHCKTSRMPETQYTIRHYLHNQAKQVTLATKEPLTLYALTHHVRKPSKTMLLNISADLQDMRNDLINNHPSMEVERLNEAAAQVVPWSECMQWLNADGSLKSFRVTINDKMAWRTVAESADIIDKFDQSAHEYCITRYSDVDGMNEHEAYITALVEAWHIHSSLKRATSELKDKTAEYEDTLTRIDNISRQVHELLS